MSNDQKDQRNLWIKIRVSLAEKQRLQQLAQQHQTNLSELIRTGMGKMKPWTPAQRKFEQQRQIALARIGNNLNQIAHKLNSNQHINVLLELRAIKNALEEPTHGHE